MKKIIFMFVLFVFLLSSITTAQELTYGIAVKVENTNMENMVLFGGNFEINLSDGLLINGFIGTDIGFDENQFYTEIDFLKKFSEEKNYYLGLGYKNIKDKESDFNGGDAIRKSILYAKLVGKNSYNGYDLTTDISYSPYGKFEYNSGVNVTDMNSWYVELEIEKQISDKLNVLFTTSYGKDQYFQNNSNVTSYLFGLNYDI